MGPQLLVVGAHEVTVMDCALPSRRGGAKVPTPFDAVITAFAPHGGLTQILTAAQESGRITGWAIFTGDESRRFDRRRPPPSAPVIRRISLHRSVAGLTIEQYRRHFTDHFIITRDHMALAWRYRQTDVAQWSGPLAFEVDGISEFWLENIEALTDPYGGDPAAKAAVGADSRLFVDATTSVTVSGYERDGQPAAAPAPSRPGP